MLNRTLLAVIAVLGLLGSAPARAAGNQFVDSAGNAFDGQTLMCVTGATVNGKQVVAPCSSGTPLQISGSFSATLSGFTPGSAFAGLSPTTSSASVALPAGVTVVIYNTGLNGAHVRFGGFGVTATSANDYIPPGCSAAFTTGSNTYLAAITDSGSTSLIISGGSGLGNGACAGNSGSVAVTGTFWQAIQPVSLASVPLPTGAATSALQSSILAALGSPFQTGGSVGISQTTPDTTNRVSAGTINSVCVTPTITAGTYTVGQEIGGLMTFANLFNAAGRGVVQTLSVNSKTKQASGAVRFYPFAANPSNSTWTDHATPSIAAADVFAARTPTDLATPYSDLGTHTIWGAVGIGQAINPGSTSLWGVLVATTPLLAFNSTGDIQVCIKTLAD